MTSNTLATTLPGGRKLEDNGTTWLTKRDSLPGRHHICAPSASATCPLHTRVTHPSTTVPRPFQPHRDVTRTHPAQPQHHLAITTCPIARPSPSQIKARQDRLDATSLPTSRQKKKTATAIINSNKQKEIKTHAHTHRPWATSAEKKTQTPNPQTASSVPRPLPTAEPPSPTPHTSTKSAAQPEPSAPPPPSTPIRCPRPKPPPMRAEKPPWQQRYA